MRWRALLAPLLGLLLLLPLAWALQTAMLGGFHPAPEAKVVPMLSPGERQRLMSYERPCSGRKDCQPPLACFFNPRSMWRYCTDSRCMTDQQCSEDMVCRTVETIDEASPSACPEGYVCDIGACRKACDPAVPEACGPHYKCYRPSEKYAWACEPDL